MQHLSSASSNLATEVAPFCWPFNRSLNSMLPAQLTPSPKYPGLQVHVKERLVLVQYASSWQLCCPVLHSSTNQQVEVLVLKLLWVYIVLEEKNFVLICSTKCFYSLQLCLSQFTMTHAYTSVNVIKAAN